MVELLPGSVKLNAGKFMSCCVTGGFSRRAQLREVRYGILIKIYLLLPK
jgi:hypothetical protein